VAKADSLLGARGLDPFCIRSDPFRIKVLELELSDTQVYALQEGPPLKIVRMAVLLNHVS